MESGEESTFQTTTFEGRISTEDLDEPITFVAHAGDDRRLNSDPLIVPGHVYVALTKSMGKPGGQSEPVTLVGMSSHGIKFFSENMRVRSFRINTVGFQIQLAADEASITLPRETDSGTDDIGLILSFAASKVSTPTLCRHSLDELSFRVVTKPYPPMM
ncbi:hypothetical protein [Cognatiyoonia sp. IB215182]|uniref:hypothetical protein n=1 Tax=Cognatiyoonia sp. IB215182 TaxID=3097353 RepID=UPI002A0CBAA4|nr:hypothetical protein [Cognatiyoonia sp. IB215182]MDX8355745.1 hypothetical protein [Cognatiyoonia sp. IB215182]